MPPRTERQSSKRVVAACTAKLGRRGLCRYARLAFRASNDLLKLAKACPPKPFLIFNDDSHRSDMRAELVFKSLVERVLLDAAIMEYPIVLATPFDGSAKEAAHEHCK